MKLSLILFCGFLFFTIVPHAYGIATHDLSTTSEYNIRVDGAGASQSLSLATRHRTTDIDRDGVKELLIGGLAPSSDTSYIYAVPVNLLDEVASSGQTLDLGDTSNYLVRFSIGNYRSINYGYVTDDIDGDGYEDIMFTIWSGDVGGTDRGSIYIVYSDMLTSISGTGNTYSLDSSGKWNIRFDGEFNLKRLASMIQSVDVDNDGNKDLIFSAAATAPTYTYIVSSDIFGGISKTSTGNVFSMTSSSSYTVRITDAYVPTGSLYDDLADLDDDGYPELALVRNLTIDSIGGRGVTFIIRGSLLKDFTGTGDTLDLSTSTNYWFRIIGPAVTNAYCFYPFLQESYNSFGDTILMNCLFGGDYNNAPDSGGYYIIGENIFSDIVDGTDIDLSNSTSYSVRLDGPDSGGRWYTLSGHINDHNGDGYTDILALTYNSTDLTTTTYVVSGKSLDTLTSGSSVDLISNRTPLLASWTIPSGGTGSFMYDFNGDGRVDIFLNAPTSDFNSRTNSGSMYIVHNFPHTLSVTDTSLSTSSSQQIITGSVTASSPITTIAGVEYNIDSNAPGATWSDCDAVDGSFNSVSEEFSCTVTGLTNGTRTVYMRARDENSSYTIQANYGSATVIVSIPSTSSSGTSSSQSSSNPQIVKNGGGAFYSVTSGGLEQKIIAVIEPGTMIFDAYFSASPQSSANLPTLTSSTSQGNSLTAGPSEKPVIGVKNFGRIDWQIGNIYEVWFKDFYNGAKILPKIQSKPSIVALSFKNADLIISGKPGEIFDTKYLRLAHSEDGVTWRILSTSVVDTVNKTVAALHKVGGYYMIVAGGPQAARQSAINSASVRRVKSHEEFEEIEQDDQPNEVIELELALPQDSNHIQNIIESISDLFRLGQ